MAQKVNATVITGFLGSGKTTMIRHILANANGRRIALIINEFGDLGVDGDILKGCGDDTCSAQDVVELSNGCICCTVADDFIPTMEKLLACDPAPDHIVIETSGLALPHPLVRAFNWPSISTKVTVDGVITMVDAMAVSEGRFAQDPTAIDAQRAQDDSLDHDTPLSELFKDQIACADMIVVNKTDLLNADRTADLVAQLKSQTRDAVQLVTAQHGALPVDVILGQGIGAETDMATRHEHHHHHDHDDDHDNDHHHHDHDHDDFMSFVVNLSEIDDFETYQIKLADAIKEHDILRLKGFAAISGKPLRRTIQAVGPRIDSYFDQPFGDQPRQTQLVVIGHSGLDRDAITAALRP